MGLNKHAQFQVATKALIANGDKILVLITPDGYLDFPGGRVDIAEVELSWHDALQREITEETGPDMQVDIGRVLFVSKRAWQKEGYVNRIATIFFACTLTGSSEVTLSEEHNSYSWMTPQELLVTDQKFMSDDEKSQLHTHLKSITAPVSNIGEVSKRSKA